MIWTILLFLGIPLSAQDFTVESFDKEGAAQGFGINLDNKLSVDGGTVTGRVVFSSGTVLRGSLAVSSSGSLIINSNGSDIIISTYNTSVPANASFSVLNSSGIVHYTTPAVRVASGTAQTLANDAITAIAFGVERFDVDDMHSNTTNNTRLTATRAGVYIICGHVVFAGNANGQRRLQIRYNGTTSIGTTQKTNLSGAADFISVCAIYQLAVSDYVELVARQDSGGNLDLILNSQDSMEFGMAYIGN